MILVDFSSIVHRMLNGTVSRMELTEIDGKYVTSEFINVVKYYILNELFSIKQQHESRFGDIVICLDKPEGGYWRRDVYPGYKARRKTGRDESKINFSEFFGHINELTEQIRNNLPWKIVDVNRAEADDIILVLAREYGKFEEVLIHSPDKDMIQAQRHNDNVYQYSALTSKWIVPETKHDHMDAWLQEHICLGDAGDDVPRVVDHTEFSKSFLEHLHSNGFIEVQTPLDFRTVECSEEDKIELLKKFDVWKTNKKGEKTELDVYKDIRFGPATLKKEIENYGSLDGWLDSNPLYREHYNRNYVLVIDEGIPTDIWNEITITHKEASTEYNDKVFSEYLTRNNLQSIEMILPNHFKLNRKLTAEDFDW